MDKSKTDKVTITNKLYDSGRSGKILLLLCDNNASTDLLVNRLGQLGRRVWVVQSSDEIVDSAIHIRPDLILFDIEKPDLDGHELCRRLKEQADTCRIPIIFFNMPGSRHSIRTAYEVGVVDCVITSVQIDELIGRVDTQLELAALRNNLEFQVTKRTAELVTVNRQLREELDEVRDDHEKLAASEHEFRILAEHIPDFLARYDRQCRLIYLNPQLEETLGVKLSEVKGCLLADIRPGDQVEHANIQAYMQRVMDTGQSSEFEMAIPDSEEGERYHNIRLVAERDMHGQIVGVLALGRDISENKIADKKLHEQQQVLIAAVENTPDFIARYDRECRRIYVNGAMQRIFGQPSDQMLGLRPTDGSKIAQPEKYQMLISKVIETGEEQRAELPYFDNGNKCWVDIRFAPEFGANGEVVSVLSVGRDVTERHALERENALFVAMAEHAVDTLIFAHSLDVGFGLPLIYYNPSFARHFGYSYQEMGKLCVRDLTPYSREELSAHMDALRKEKSLRFEAEYIRKNGDYVPVEVIMHYLEYDGEELAAGYCIDISERKAAEHKLRENKNALRENERKFRTLAENITDNIARYDLECRVVYANPQLESLIVPVFGPMLGKKPTESASDWPHVQKYQEAIEHVITTGDSASIEVTITPPDQSVQIHQINVVAERRPNGVMRGALAIGRDITSLKETEKRLEESHAQLQDITKRRETAQEEERKHIARELHDDLGQYLTALSLQATALQVGFGRKNRKHEKMIEHIIALIDGMKQSVRNLSHRLRPEALRMGLNAAIECLAVDILSQSGIDYATELYKNIDEIGDAGTAVVYRVTQESLTNIVRYAEAKHVSISLERRDDQFVLIIGDDGKGFDTSMVKPTSFGLIGMRERLQAIGGELEIISETQLGTTIIAYIPVL